MSKNNLSESKIIDFENKSKNLKENNYSSNGLLSKLNNFIDFFSFLFLSLVVFGIFSLGFMVAPVIFKNLNPRHLASEIMTDIFLRYYSFAIYCISVIAILEIIRFIINGKKLFKYKSWIIQTLCIFSVCFLTGYSAVKIAPEINEMRLNNKKVTLWNEPEFIKLHNQSESFAKITFMIGLIPFGLMLLRKKNI